MIILVTVLEQISWLQNETEVTLNDMIYHTKAVCRAKKGLTW